MSKQYFRNSLLMLAAIFLAAAASNRAVTKKDSQEPTVITSDRMEANKLSDKVTFIGNVVLKKEGLTLQSDTMIVYFDATSKDIKEIDASDNVIVHKDGRVALANKGLYSSSEEKIVLTGNARIIENENVLGGNKITLFMRNDRSIVEGGTVLFYQNKTDKKLMIPSEGKKQN